MATIGDVIASIDRLPDIAAELEKSSDPVAQDAAKQILAVWQTTKQRIVELHAQHVEEGRPGH
jgi:hypothetical protein